MKSKKILYVVNHSEFFFSHRLPFALAARERGFEVHVATSPSRMEEEYTELGLTWHPLEHLDSGGMNPVTDLKFYFELRRLYTRLQPDIIHHVTIKPVIYGGIAARRTNIRGVINALSGLGYLFHSEALAARLLQAPTNILLRYAFGYPRSILLLQNRDDVELFTKRNLVEKRKTAIIRGSGVDIHRFSPGVRTHNGLPIVLLASRMLWDKGVGEFVEAAKLVNKETSVARFVLAGKPDNNNPKSIPKEQLQQWDRKGFIEWWGYRDDMEEVMRNSSVVVLPSYYEGVPKVLLEAAASAKPIIATDVPGCREIVEDGLNGFRVEVRNSEDLAQKITRLLEHKEMRERMGRESRNIAVEHFTLGETIEKTFRLYYSLLENRRVALKPAPQHAIRTTPQPVEKSV